MKRINFYCHRCREDWHLEAELAWLNTQAGEAWQAYCPGCNKKLVRLRDTMAKDDPYFRKSRYTKMQLRKHLDHLIQPGDPRFNLLYPHVKKQQEANQEPL